MPRQRSDLQEDVHFRVMQKLASNPEMSQRDLAAEVGVSVGRIHYVLRALIERGLIKTGNFRASPDKRRYAYVLTPRGVAEKTAMTQRFLARKIKEYEALKLEIEALGRDLGPDDVKAPDHRRKSH